MIVKVRATLVWRGGGGMSRTIIRGPSEWGQVNVVNEVMTPDYEGCLAVQIITRKNQKQSGWVNDVPNKSLWKHGCSQLTSDKSDENRSTTGCGLGEGITTPVGC